MPLPTHKPSWEKQKWELAQGGKFPSKLLFLSPRYRDSDPVMFPSGVRGREMCVPESTAEVFQTTPCTAPSFRHQLRTSVTEENFSGWLQQVWDVSIIRTHGH